MNYKLSDSNHFTNVSSRLCRIHDQIDRRMNRIVYMITTALVACSLISGCKIVITTPPRGGYVAAEGQEVCSRASTCVIEVKDTEFDQTFIAKPHAWYVFSHWKKAPSRFCGGTSGACRLYTTSFDKSNQSLIDILESDREFYLEPVFERQQVPQPSIWRDMQTLRAGAFGFHYAATQADFNGDGYTDIFVAPGIFLSYERSPIELYLNDGNDNFYLDNSLFQNPQDGGLHPRKAVSADLNGDGKPDILVADSGVDEPPFPGHYPLIYMSSENGYYRVKTFDDLVGYHHSVTLGDMDNDGDIDGFFTDNFGWSFFLINDGKGNFTYDISRLPGESSNKGYYTSELIDVDEDGFLDLIMGGHEYEGAPTVIYWGTPRFKFYGENKVVLPSILGSRIVMDIDVSDLNGDKIKDIVLNRVGSPPQHEFYGPGGKYFQIFRGTGNGRKFKDVTEESIDLSSVPDLRDWITWLRLEDRNGDGYTDLLAADDWSYSERYVFLNNGKGSFSNQR